MALGVTSVAAVPRLGGAATNADPSVVHAHDERLARLLDAQVSDSGSRWYGGVTDGRGLHGPREAAHLLQEGAAAYYHPASRFHGSQDLYAGMERAVAFLERYQHEDGNIDLLSTNFNSPPDTGFVVHLAATAARLARMHDDRALLASMEAFLRGAGRGMAKGGIHTPNHRWVVCAALAQVHDLFPDKRHLKRIDEWLAEGIDIDKEGQFLERSTASYNAVVDNALVVVAHLLKRPRLLDPVRKNLDAMAYLLHPNGEVVTEISRRQDSNTRGTMRGYWLALRYMAIREGNGLYASMLQPLEPECVQLAKLMAYPELQQDLPVAVPIPEEYARDYPLSGITRIRRGKTSVTLMHKRNSRWIALRHGEAVVNAVRVATSFFGKGQFRPAVFRKEEDGYYFGQKMQAGYYQPVTDPDSLPIDSSQWTRLKGFRKQSELCRLAYEGRVRETDHGLEVAISAQGTPNVPLAVEINLREGGALSGVAAAPNVNEALLLKEGFAEYRVGDDIIRFGPGLCEHAYVQVRGAEAKLPGPSVYLTSYTPFRHTLTFHMG